MKISRIITHFLSCVGIEAKQIEKRLKILITETAKFQILLV